MYKSKTMWFAVLLALFGALFEYLPLIKDFIDPKFYGFSFIIIAAVVAVLRVFTTTSLSDK